MNKLEKISIIGGGTAGFVAALILKTRFPQKTIQVIRSTKIGIIGVGEGSTEHWTDFVNYIGINPRAVISYCNATFKSGIMFKGWGKYDYLHSIGPEADIKNGQYQAVYGKLISEGAPKELFNPSLTWQNKIFEHQLDPNEILPYNQYHFDTNKLNEFLTTVAKLKDIDVIDDEIVDVELNDQGEIKRVLGEKQSYEADFYIDSTGFKKILMSKLGAKWQSYSEYLKMNSAIVFPIGDTEEYNMWTVAQAMDYGWMFKIPVWGRSGNGYIFDSNYITPQQAQEEVEKFLGHPITIGKHLTFDPGALDQVWIKNCCAIGLSASFVEPLEATSIGSSIQQAFLLMHRLPNYNEKTIKRYNKDVSDILTNIRDFVILHYMTNRNDTPFWKDVAKVKLPSSLSENLEKWRNNLPIAEDFRGTTDYVMFRESHYIHVLNGLRLFNQENIRQEYKMQSPKIQEWADNVVREKQTFEKLHPAVGHKEFIGRIRNLVKK